MGIEERMAPVLSGYGVKYGVFADRSGAEVWRFGDLGALKYKKEGVLDQLFGSIEERAKTHDWLADRILPQTVRQGPDECVVSRYGDVVYGLFVERHPDADEDFQRKEALVGAVDEVLRQMGFDSPPS